VVSLDAFVAHHRSPAGWVVARFAPDLRRQYQWTYGKEIEVVSVYRPQSVHTSRIHGPCSQVVKSCALEQLTGCVEKELLYNAFCQYSL